MEEKELDRLKKIEEYFNRQRRNLVLSSSILLFCNLTKAQVGTINLSGLTLSFKSESHNAIVYVFLFFVIVYFYFRFKQYRYSYKKVIDEIFYEELTDRVNKFAYDYYYQEVEEKIKLKYPTATRVVIRSIRVAGGQGGFLNDGQGNTVLAYAFHASDASGKSLASEEQVIYQIDDFKSREFKLRAENDLMIETPWMTEYKFPVFLMAVSIFSIINWFF